jgi:hypothetical protein
MSQLMDFHPADALYRDQENIENVKEGRRAEAVLNMINYTPTDRRNAIEEAKRSFEARIYAHEKRMEGKEAEYGPQDDEDDEDPLRIWVQYVNWLRDHCVLGSAFRLEALPVLENVLQKLQDDLRYKNDPRYVKLWLNYADFSTSPQEIYKYMYTHDIGNLMAAFYQGYASVLEKSGMWNDADLVYAEGVQIRAQPLERLKKHYKEFQKRMIEAIGDFGSENNSLRRDRHGERRPLQLLGTQTQSQSVGPQNLRTGGPVGDFELKADLKRSTPLKTGPLTKGAISWSGFPLETRKNRENQVVPSKWTELGTLPLKSTEHLSKRRAQEDDVLDEHINPYKSTATPPQDTQHGLKSAHNVLKGQNPLQIAISTEEDEELSFEEIRALAYKLSMIDKFPIDSTSTGSRSLHPISSPSASSFAFSSRLLNEEPHVTSPTINTKAALKDVMEMFSQPMSKILSEEEVHTILPNNPQEDTFVLPVWSNSADSTPPTQSLPALENTDKSLQSENQENISPLDIEAGPAPQRTRPKDLVLQEINVAEMPEYKAIFEELETQRKNRRRSPDTDTSLDFQEGAENLDDDHEDVNLQPPMFNAFYKEPDVPEWKFKVYEDPEGHNKRTLSMIQSTPSRYHVPIKPAQRHSRDPLTPILELSTELDRSLTTHNLSGIVYRNLSPVEDMENQRLPSPSTIPPQMTWQESSASITFEEFFVSDPTYHHVSTPFPFGTNTDLTNTEIQLDKRRLFVQATISRDSNSIILLVTPIEDDILASNDLTWRGQMAWILKISKNIGREFYTYRRLRETPNLVDFCLICESATIYDDCGCLLIEYSDQSSLADVVQMYQKKGLVLPEMLILFYLSRLLRFVELLHQISVIHGQLSLSHLLLKMDEMEFDNEWSASYDPSGGHGWNKKGLRMIDFSGAVHVDLEPQRRNLFSLDYIHICQIALDLLAPSYGPMQIFDNNNEIFAFDRSRAMNHLPSFSTSLVPFFWSKFFNGLLEISNEGPNLPTLVMLRQEIDQILLSHTSSGRSLKSLLKQLEVYMFEYKSP